MLKVIMSMFDKAQARVQQQNEIGPSIESLFGVLQGGILSPKLFNEYLYDLHTCLNKKDGIEIEGTHFTHLLYADDIVLIADSPKSLQNSINNLHNFCAKWHLIVNTAKTKVMTVGRNSFDYFTYNNEVIENVGSYQYLGSIIDSHKGIHHKMIDHVVRQAQKALFALRAKLKSNFGCLPPQLALKMFDSYILPIIEYNNVLWAKKMPIPEIEKIQVQYLKNMLNVRKQTPTLAVYAETGRFPLYMRQKIAIIKYWNKLEEQPEYDILNKCLQIQKRLTAQDSWYNKVKHIISEASIPNWNSIEPNRLVSQIKIALYDKEKSRIFDEINDSCKQSKLRTYKIFKTTFCLEPYLTFNLQKKTYTNIARFRVSSHNLRIETGRHESPKLPAADRVCNKCDSNEVEDELHCLLICKYNEVPRLHLLNEIINFFPNLHSLNHTQQFQAIMSSKEFDVIKAVGSFLNAVL